MSNSNMQDSSQRDEQLWTLAKKRAGFQRHLVTYMIMNSFFWAIWWFTGANREGVPWPVWPMLGWGIGLGFNYADAYIFPRQNSVENEYQKLLREKEEQNKY